MFLSVYVSLSLKHADIFGRDNINIKKKKKKTLSIPGMLSLLFFTSIFGEVFFNHFFNGKYINKLSYLENY